MTTPRQPPGIVVRPAQERDGPALAAFRCATGPLCELEVEDFVQHRALDLVLKPKAGYRLLLVIEVDRLVACAAHHVEVLPGADVESMAATRLHLLALSRFDQGRRLDDGRRLSDVVMDTLIVDALETRESRILTAIVARENLRSVALCERHGLRSQIRHDSLHLRLTGHFTLRV